MRTSEALASSEDLRRLRLGFARGCELAAAIASRVDNLRSVIDGNGADLVTALGERGDDVSSRIAVAGARAVQTLDQQMGSLSALLTRRTDELIAAVNSAAADPVRMLTSLSGQLRAEIATSTETLRSVAENTSQRSNETRSGLYSGDVTEQIEISGSSLRDALERSAETSVGALAGTGDRLRNELAQVIDNLGKTSSAIDQAVASAGDRLAAVQGGLATKVEEFQRALGGIASQVSTLGRLSSSTQADAGALASQLSRHAESLASVAEDLAAQQGSLDLAIERREQQSAGPHPRSFRTRRGVRHRSHAICFQRRGELRQSPGPRPGNQRSPCVGDKGRVRSRGGPVRNDPRYNRKGA